MPISRTFINVYDAEGRAVILASADPLSRTMARAFYEHALNRPDYDVCLTEAEAKAAAQRRLYW